MLDEREYNRWIEMARQTLKSAERDLRDGDYSWACFKAQQAAELAVKALLRGIGAPAYGHSVSRLLAGLQEKVRAGEVMESAKLLDKYYVLTRYPDAWPEGVPSEYFTEKEARDAIAAARSVVEWVEGTWASLTGG